MPEPISTALAIGFLKGLGIKGILAKLGLVAKATAATTMKAKLAVVFGATLGGGISVIAIQHSVRALNEYFEANGYSFRVSEVGAKAAIATIESSTELDSSKDDYGVTDAMVAGGFATAEGLFESILTDNGYDADEAGAYSALTSCAIQVQLSGEA